MIASSYDPGPTVRNGSSVAARWISGLGAFLLVAAAATFVAVRWDQIPDEAKFGALVALTGTCLAADTWLRSRLPITAAAIFHLGVLLVPIDVAAVGLWFGWDWPTMLLSQGLALTVACGVAGYARQSVVLIAAAALGVVLLASGAGAVSEAPAGLLLAIVALGLAVASLSLPGRARQVGERASATWAALAGLATPLAAAEDLGLPAAGVLSDLGIASDAPHPVAAVTGVVSGAALAIVATRRRSLPVALLAVASLLTGAVTTWSGLSPSGPASLVALAAVLLLTEVTAWLLRRDSFWSTPTNVVARLGEVVAGTMTVGFGVALLSAPFPTSASPTSALAAALVALTWVANAGRVTRPDPRRFWPWTTVPVGLRGTAPFAAALTAAAAGVLATETRPIRALVILGLGGLVMAFPPTALPGAIVNRVLAVGLLVWAPVVVSTQPGVAGPVALAGASIVAATAADTARFSGTAGFNRLVYTLTFLSLTPLAVGGIIVSAHGEAALAVGGVIVAGWLLAALLDRVTVAPPLLQPWAGVWMPYRPPRPMTLPVGMVPRLATLVPLATVPLVASAFTPGEALAIAGLFAVLALVDAIRLDEPLLLVGTGCAVPIALASGALMTDGSLAQASVALTLSGLVWLGIGGYLPERWAPPAALSAGIGAAAGLLVSTEESWAFSANLVVMGLAVILLGIAIDHLGFVAAGGVAATLGLWVQLDHHEVTASEAYLAPVALMLVIGGLYSRRSSGRPVSSWLAYAPAVALLGGAGLVERLGDGSGWHAVLAGAVGVVAVVVGGSRRLAGPLFTGTVVVVATTIHEVHGTMDTAAEVPTWAWLAAGGATLLGIGLFMERQGTGPLETGRRLVDLVSERFS